MLKSIEWVLFAVGDLDDATTLWTRVLGVPPVWRGEHPASRAQCTVFRFANTGFVLLSNVLWDEYQNVTPDGLADRGLYGVVFGTDDAVACARELSARGFAVRDPEPGLARDLESGAFCKWTGFALPQEAVRGVNLFVMESQAPNIAPPAADVPAEAVQSIDHVVLRTRAPEAARALYEDALGLRLALTRKVKEWDAHMQFFRLGGVTFEVVAPLSQEQQESGWNGGVSGDFNDAAHEASGDRDHLWGLAFRVGSAEAAQARIQSMYIIPTSEVRKGRKRGTRVFHLRRFDGGSFGPHATLGVPVLFIEQAR